MSDALDRRLVAVMFTDMVGYTALMQADERLGRRQAAAVHRRARAPSRRLRRDDRAAAGRREHEHVPELARRGAGRGRDPAGARRAGRAGADRHPRRRGHRRARAAHGRGRQHRRADRVVRRAGRRDALRRRLRAAPEPQRRRGRPARAVPAEERRAAVRALRGRGGRGRRPDPAALEGKGERLAACRATCPSRRHRWSAGLRTWPRSSIWCASTGS